MRHPNADLIDRFYSAFQRRDADAMAACYADDVVFDDPVFGELRGDEARDMWRMLCERAQGFSLSYEIVGANDTQGHARWVASYQFSQTGRDVVNRIDARFGFRDGRIAEHRDSFSMWLWLRQALGIRGTLLGWSPLIQRMIRSQARRGLTNYRRHERNV